MTRKSRRVGWINTFMSQDEDPNVFEPKKFGLLTCITLAFIIMKLYALWDSSKWLVTMYNFDNYPTSFYASDKGCYVNDSSWCVSPWSSNTVPNFWFAFKVWIYSVFSLLGAGMLIVADYTNCYSHAMIYNYVWYAKAAYVMCRQDYSNILTVIQFDEFHMAETSVIYMMHTLMVVLHEKNAAKKEKKEQESSEDLEPICDTETAVDGDQDESSMSTCVGKKETSITTDLLAVALFFLTGAYNVLLFIVSIILMYQWLQKCEVKCPEHEAVSFSGIVESMYGIDEKTFG